MYNNITSSKSMVGSTRNTRTLSGIPGILVGKCQDSTRNTRNPGRKVPGILVGRCQDSTRTPPGILVCNQDSTRNLPGILVCNQDSTRNPPGILVCNQDSTRNPPGILVCNQDYQDSARNTWGSGKF